MQYRLDASVTCPPGFLGRLPLFSEPAEEMTVIPSLSSDAVVVLARAVHGQQSLPRPPALPPGFCCPPIK